MPKLRQQLHWNKCVFFRLFESASWILQNVFPCFFPLFIGLDIVPRVLFKIQQSMFLFCFFSARFCTSWLRRARMHWRVSRATISGKHIYSAVQLDSLNLLVLQDMMLFFNIDRTWKDNRRFSPDSMDVDSPDESPPVRDSTLVNIFECVLPGDVAVTIVEGREEVQAQWSISSFLKNIFSTKDTDSLRQHFADKLDEIKEVHERIWPGYVVPPMFLSKHDQADQEGRGESLGPTFLKTKTMPTSIAMSWIVWSVSKSKRRDIDRVKSQTFLRNLLVHVLEVAGTLQFSVVAVAKANARAKDIEISERNDCIDYRNLWDNKIKGRIVWVWEETKRRGESQITSNWDRPHWIDFIVFALDPKSGSAPQLLAPVAWSILAQTAAWMDTNMGRLALSFQSVQNSRHKNRQETLRVTKQDLTHLAQFLLFENEPLLHYGALC